MRLRFLAVCAALLVMTLSARADQIFSLSGSTFNSSATGGGTSLGTLSGSFTTNDSLSTVLSFNLTASASGSFAGYTYTTTNSAVTASSLPSQYFQIDSNTGGNELRLYFTTGGLTSAGGTLNPTFSYESERLGGNRYLSGAVVKANPVAVTPEPSSFALLGTGLLGMAGVLRKRFA